MTIEEMKRRKEELGYTNAELARISGVPLGTVQRVMSGETKNPRRDTWEALELALSDDGYGSSSRWGAAYNDPYTGDFTGTGNDHLGDGFSGCVREVMASYGKKQGEYTLDDYYSFPDDIRVELIDGVIYDMTLAPMTYHQIFADEIRYQIRNCIDEKKRNCVIVTAPDVQLDRDEKTMVQPDVVLVCDREIVIGRCVYGAPDFVVEVLSRSTRKKDMVIKLKKYMEAGVQVYWMVDLKNRKLIEYVFDGDMIPAIHGLEGRVTLSLQDRKVEQEKDKAKHKADETGRDKEGNEYKFEVDLDVIMEYLGDILDK